MSAARLVLEVVGDDGARVELPRSGVLTLGSAAGRADLLLVGQGVADVHCAIGRAKGGGWALKDLGSNYGTLVNGERARTVKLAAGDEIVVGSRRLRVVDPALSPPVEAPRPRAAPSALDEVAGYRIEKALGRGGMGQVFLAVQESLQRKVALKVLSESLAADADFVRRFQAEARAAAALNHPNIVTVHDVWEEGGRHLLSMEYMDCGTLEARVAALGRLPWREALDVLSDAAKGLVYAELRGIVHRDIKPANLMLNEVGTTKISDLGLATHLEAEATQEEGRKIFGTPHFISPEQARGERVDGRSDLYSLGATAYRLLTGRTPFEGATTREILRGHFFDPPAPIAERAPEVPAELAAVVMRLLQKDPADRFPSAGALLHELERLRSLLVHGVSAVGQAPGAGRRSLAAFVVVALLAAAAWVAWKALDDGPAEIPVREPEGGGEHAAAQGQDPPPEQQPGETGPAPPPDDDSALERLELEAQRAYAALSPDLDDVGRRMALLGLAREYAGSTWASRFEVEAQSLERRIAEAEQAASAAGQSAAQALDRLRAAARGDGTPRALGATLSALAAVPPDPALEGESAATQVTEVWREAVRAAAARGRAALRLADERAARGEFEDLEQALGSARSALSEDSWPQLSEALASALAPDFDEVREVRARLGARVDGLDLERLRFERAQRLADRRAYAEAVAGAGALERELRDMDWQAADARLASLESTLSLERERASAAALRADLAAGRRALQALADEWSRAGWKRRTVNDPRSRGRVHREAVGADARGVLLKQGSETSLVAWSEFGGRPLELHQLFLERIQRPYTPDELTGIEALLRVGAVLMALEEASEMLRPDANSVLTAEEHDALLAGYELADHWAEQSGRTLELAHEEQAARRLAGALRAASVGDWDAAATFLERLLTEHRDTLLVRLLSDGRELPGLDPELPAPPPPDAPQDPPPGEGGERDG